MRKDTAGKYIPVTLKAPMAKMPVIKFNALNFNTTATADQLKLRDAWLKQGT